MADKNFARSGTADTDLLADDDPLSELARLVNFDPRPVQGADAAFSAARPAPSRQENPVLALEDELMRAFEQYDAPARVVAEPVVAEAMPRHVEPVFEEPLPAAEDRAAFIDEAPTRDIPASAYRHPEPAFAEPSFTELSEPVEAEDPSLFLADELEASVHEVPAVDAEPVAHAGLQFADRFEPRFEETPRQEPAADFRAEEHVEENAPQPAFLGLQPVTEEPLYEEDMSLDLERELELSIGDGFADEAAAEATFAEPLPAVADVHAEPEFGNWSDTPAPDAAAFAVEPAYAGEEPKFVSEMPFETREERAHAVAEAETQWQAEALDPVFEAAPDYQVQSVEKGGSYDHDDLLAEVERYPVPESRSPFSETVTAAAAVTPRHTPANIPALFGRATPVVHREPAPVTVVAPVEETVRAVEPPVAETRNEPFVLPTPAVREPDLDFDTMEFDLSDIELDLSDFSLDDEPVKEEARPAPVKAEIVTPEIARPVQPVQVETPVRREPAVAVPVAAYRAPQPAGVDADGALPFDPSLIAETDEGVTPVTELDVPQLPVVEKEKPPVYQQDYDFDIDAEMAQLFNEPAAKPVHGEDPSAGVAAASQPVTQINDVDDFERALEEDFRRSLNQPERMAIPVDPGQANGLYGGDGYDDAQARPRRGMLIAASVAGLLLVGGGAVYAWSALMGGAEGSGEPRVILADKDPVKVVPEEKGGKTVPNQDKAVYDRVAGDKVTRPQQEQLVTTREEPVDVVQRTLTPEALPDDSADTGLADDDSRLLPGVDEPETANAEAGNKPLISPRKVKTMIVKPDGTLVAREDTVTEPETETASLDAKATATTGQASGEAVTTVDADASLRTEQASAEARPRSALAEAAEAKVEDTAPVRTVKTTTIGANGTTRTDDSAPVPETRPIDQPVNVVGTVTETGRQKATETQAGQTQVAAVAPGGYVMQIASLPSEAEAQKSYAALSKKFSSVLGGHGVDIQKAEIANKGTYFRVRIPAGSREEAIALCERYRGAGGSCLVTR